MRSRLFSLALATFLTTTALPGTAADSAAGPAARAFEQLKGLAGEWIGTADSHGEVHISYEIVSGGTAVLERERMADHPEMVTLYHLDGDRLLLTHYCVGNQPRMAARSFDDGGVQFELVDATGLASSGAGHMHRAEFELDGKDRLRSTWTWREQGADTFTVVVDARRVR